VVLDEIHRVPELFPTLRGLIDRGPPARKKVVRFLIPGSASRDLLRQSSESLAGRIAYVELAPFGWKFPGMASGRSTSSGLCPPHPK